MSWRKYFPPVPRINSSILRMNPLARMISTSATIYSDAITYCLYLDPIRKEVYDIRIKDGYWNSRHVVYNYGTSTLACQAYQGHVYGLADLGSSVISWEPVGLKNHNLLYDIDLFFCSDSFSYEHSYIFYIIDKNIRLTLNSWDGSYIPKRVMKHLDLKYENMRMYL